MEQGLLFALVASLLAGLAMPLGALLARAEQLRHFVYDKEIQHGVMAFGGGALFSAVALVLVPEGIEPYRALPATALLICGGLAFMALDIYLARHKTPASQLAAMLSDFIPEAIALGAAFALGGSSALLIALLIGLQNLPEGFNAYREMIESGSFRARTLILSFTGLALLGPLAAFSGYVWLSHLPVVLAGIMLFAAGGILYSVFEDIAPQVKLEHRWSPPLGAVLGFALGLIGQMLSAG